MLTRALEMTAARMSGPPGQMFQGRPPLAILVVLALRPFAELADAALTVALIAARTAAIALVLAARDLKEGSCTTHPDLVLSPPGAICRATPPTTPPAAICNPWSTWSTPTARTPSWPPWLISRPKTRPR